MYFNKDRARAMMVDCGLDALVATSPVNVTYLTDYTCWIDSLFRDYMMSPGASSHKMALYAVYCVDGSSCLVVNPLMAANATDTWVEDLVTYGASSWDLTDVPDDLEASDQRLLMSLNDSGDLESATAALLAWLRGQGLEGASIGVELEGFRPDAEAEIRSDLEHARIRDCSNLMRMIRMVKSHDEIERLRAAARISEEAALATLELVRPGASFSEMVALYRELVARNGAEFDHYAYGIRGTGLITRVDMILTPGHYSYMDYGCIYQGYFSDTGFTLAVGESNDSLDDQYRALVECHQRGVEQIHPGASSSGPAMAMESVLSAAGFADTFPHGHGVGLEVRDYPIIVPPNGLRIADDCIDLPADLPFEENMVVNLEAGTFLFGKGSTQYEQTLLVTADGCEPLVPHDRSEIYVRG